LDPFPLIVLHLLLSFPAAYTAPVIMMRQNRLSDMDRERALADHQVTLRAEPEIAPLHEKVDLMRERELFEVTGLLRETLASLQALKTRERPA
jgi:uncharacterized membrane protein